MDRMLVVVFDTEDKAYKGRNALLKLDDEGSIAVFAYAVVARNADGTATVKQGDDPGPFGTLVGTSLGSLIGLLGGPAGLAIGATVGLLAGTAADLNKARVGGDFIDDITTKLLPGKFAVVAEVQENWTTPVDFCMESIDGTVFRRALSEVKHTADEEEIVAMKAELAQAHADRKAKLQEKINQLDAKIETSLQKAQERRRAAELQAKAKVEALKAKAAALKSKVTEAHV